MRLLVQEAVSSKLTHNINKHVAVFSFSPKQQGFIAFKHFYNLLFTSVKTPQRIYVQASLHMALLSLCPLCCIMKGNLCFVKSMHLLILIHHPENR